MRIIVGTISIFFGIFLGFFAFYMFNIHGSRYESIPDLTGRSCKYAKEKLMEMGFNVVATGSGTVISLYPSPGMMVRRSRSVKIFCIKEEENFDMSLIDGASIGFVEKLSSILGLNLIVSRMRYRGNIGEVISHRIEGKKLYVLVDSGPPESYGIVPNLIGLDRKDAERKAEENGLKIEFLGNGDYVIDQSPEPGCVATAVIVHLE